MSLADAIQWVYEKVVSTFPDQLKSEEHCSQKGGRGSPTDDHFSGPTGRTDKDNVLTKGNHHYKVYENVATATPA